MLKRRTDISPRPQVESTTGYADRKITQKAAALFVRVLRLLLATIEFPARFILGRDFFISYSRKDPNAGEYAQNLGLEVQAERLKEKKHKTSFYLDRLMAPPLEELPRSVLRHVRWSDLLVIICTENSMQSESVRKEIAEFTNYGGGKVVPIDVGASFSKLRQYRDIWSQIGGAAPQLATADDLESGKPSAEVIERVLNSINFTVQDTRLKRLVAVASIATVIGIAALVYSEGIVADANAEAKANTTYARVSQSVAKLAENLAGKAKARENQAQQNAFNANYAREDAEAKKAVAEEATVKADKGRRAAFALKLGVEAQTAVYSRFGGQVETGVLLAAESLRREPNLEASLALNRGLDLLPKLCKTVPLHYGYYAGAWLSPHGDCLIVKKLDRTEVIDADTSKTKTSLELPEVSYLKLHFSPNGTFVLATGEITENQGRKGIDLSWFRVFRVSDGKQIGQDFRTPGRLQAAALFPDGTAFAAAVAEDGRKSKVFIVQTDGRPGAGDTIPLQPSNVTALAISNDGKRLAIGTRRALPTPSSLVFPTYAGAVDICDLPQQKTIFSRDLTGDVTCMEFSRDDRLLAVGQGRTQYHFDKVRRLVGSPMVRIWDIEQKLEVAEPMAHRLGVEEIRFRADGEQIATTGADAIARIWNINGSIARIRPHSANAGVAFLSHGFRLAHSTMRIGQDRRIYISLAANSYDSRPREAQKAIDDSNQYGRAAISSSGPKVAVAEYRGITLYTVSPPTKKFIPLTGTFLACVSNNGKYVAACTRSPNQFQVYLIGPNMASPRKLTSIERSEWEIGNVAADTRGHVVLALHSRTKSGSSYEVRLFNDRGSLLKRWNTGDRANVGNLENNVAIAPDGTTIATIEPEGRYIKLWEIVSSKPKARILDHKEAVVAVAFDRTGTLAATLGQRSCKLWTVRAGRQILNIDMQQYVNWGSLSFDRTGKYLAVTTDYGSVWLFRVEDGAVLARQEFGSMVLGAALSDDGKFLMATGRHMVLRSWLWQQQDLRNMAANYVERNLTRDEQARYLGKETYVKLRPDLESTD